MDSASRPASDPRTVLDALSDFDLDLLTVFVLVDDTLSRIQWANLADDYGLQRRPDRPLSAQDLEPLAERLLDVGLMHVAHASYLGVKLPVALEVLRISAARDRLSAMAAIHGRAVSSRRRSGYRASNRTQLRLAVLLDEPKRAAEAIAALYTKERWRIAQFVVDALGPTPSAAWLQVLPDKTRLGFLTEIFDQYLGQLLPAPDDLVDAALTADDKKLHQSVARLLVLRGEAERALALEPLPRWGTEGIAVLEAFWRGDYALAVERGNAAVASMKSRKHKLLVDLEGACHLFALAAQSSAQHHHAAQLEELLLTSAHVSSPILDNVAPPLLSILEVLTGDADGAPRGMPTHRIDGAFVWSFAWLLHEVWLLDRIRKYGGNKDHGESRRRRRGHRRTVDVESRIDTARMLAQLWKERALAGGYAAVARELSALEDALEGKRPARHLAGAFDPPDPWEMALASLEAALDSATKTEAEAEASGDPITRHLWWEFRVESDQELVIQPRVRQSKRARKGRTVSLKRLMEGEDVADLDDADRAILAAATFEPEDWTERRSRWVLGPRAVLALIGHPRVINGDGEPLAVERGQPTIVNETREGRTRVSLDPPGLARAPLVIQPVSDARVLVYERPSKLDPLVSILARDEGLAVPPEAHDRLARALTKLSASTGVSVEGDLHVGAKKQPADPRPVLQLRWDDDILDVRIRVAPLSTDGPHFKPGTGAVSILGEITRQGTTTLAQCERDLAAERARHDAMLDACPTLASFSQAPFHHVASSLSDALDILLELDALGSDVVLTWAKGQKLDRPLLADLPQLSVEVRSGTDWLGIEARVQVDDHTVLQFQQLLGAREGDRYVPIGRGRFVALSDRLRQHLDSLASLGTKAGKKGTQLRASPAVLSTLKQLADEAEDFTFDEKALARLETLDTIATWTPRLPRGFGATLRDYQRDGYLWMSRLARAGLGACLADDMGLGKTVQSLAMLCQRARGGPALVLCPTSVVLNWMSEAARFAPTLRMHWLGAKGERQALLDSLGPRDVLVSSYGLLSTEADALAEIDFHTAVFDEAHALKNHTTKRAKAARRLRAEFRLALTGTPVENHLGELWSLLSVILPGLLGSKAHFDELFTGPIAAGDRERTRQLRTLLRPFVLRRTKVQVLDELPALSEITVRVEPYPKQRAFYEAVRRKAKDRMLTVDPKRARFEILAQITRLRRAAIDPRLVDEAKGPKGAKIDVLMERLEQLCDEGHRALVFTQFLGSMAAVTEQLRDSGIEFFELDGSTPAVERTRRIEAFQSGEGDVFVLSLRAGGLGINLTGADYVFHLDPWWNPAVEDQATDRAHRIGQTRPVTVYRLVTEGTIEDKIIELHASKRQLADDVLAGLQKAKAPDLDQLRQLLEL